MSASGSSADGGDTKKVAGLQKINIAGRQRMLSQRMAKAACFRYLGIGADAHKKQLKAAHKLFSTSLKGLVDGARALGLPKETAPEILEEFAKVAELWEEFGPVIVDSAESTEFDRMLLRMSASRNVALLKQSNAAVMALEARYGAGLVDPKIAKAVNISGRQRMLTQRAAKEFCLIVAGISKSRNAKALEQTIALFDTSLKQLKNGDPEAGIIAPLDEDLAWQYETIQELWDLYRPALETVLNGTPTEEDILLVAGINNVLLTEANVAVFLYTSPG